MPTREKGEYRRAAFIATAVTLPLVVIALLGVAAVTGSADNGSKGPALPSALNLPAPPHAVAETAPCAKLLAGLPVQLGKLAPRVVHTKPDSPYVVAWGNPAVIVACGVSRPASLHPGSGTDFLAGGVATGPFYDVTAKGGDEVWTTVDRQPYIAITVPHQYQGADVVTPLSKVIAAALPAVCSTDPNEPDPAKLCTRRSS